MASDNPKNDPAVPPRLLAMGPIKFVSIDLNEKCNLRCVYCSVSSASYHGVEMPVALAKKAIELVTNLSQGQPDLTVYLNGNGETTFRDDWAELVRPVLELGISVRIQSNFAKEFSSEECEVLASMTGIRVSVDSADRALLRNLRRHVDIRQIIANIVAVRITARRLLKRPPEFSFACGLYDKNALHVLELARLAVELDVRVVDFWDLHDHGHTDNGVDENNRLRPLRSLTDDELRPRMTEVLKAVRFLKAHGVVANIHGKTFVKDLATRVGLVPDENGAERLGSALGGSSSPLNPHDLPKGMTRDCLDPWDYVEIRPNGDVRPCCARTAAGNLSSNTLAQILQGSELRALRESLLSGTPDAQCKTCRLRAVTTTGTLANKVTALVAGVQAPQNFDGGAYLEANPDVRRAQIGPADHYLKWERLEGRRLFPKFTTGKK